MPKPQFPYFAVAEDAKASNLTPQLNDTLAIAQAYLARTAEVEYVEGLTTPSVAGTPFRVSHTLGSVPRFVSAILEDSGSIYATANDKREWTDTYVKIRATVESLPLIVKLEL